MCLAKKEEKNYAGRVGYKVLLKRSKDSFVYHTGLCNYPDVPLTVGVWTRDPRADGIPTIWGGSGTGPRRVSFRYPHGFHTLLNLKDTIKLKILEEAAYPYSKSTLHICKVAFRKQVANGAVRWSIGMNKPFTTRTVVSQEIKILNEVRR